MGSIRSGSDDVRIKDSPGNIPADHNGNIRGIHPRLYAGVPRRFLVYSRQTEHLDHLRLCLEKCSEYRLSLNPAKCVFGVASGNLLGHIVSKDGITVHLDKGREILKAPTPNNAKALSRFLVQIRWHSRMIRHLADFATPLHAVVHRVPFEFAELKEKAYQALKVMLSQAPVVQPPD